MVSINSDSLNEILKKLAIDHDYLPYFHKTFFLSEKFILLESIFFTEAQEWIKQEKKN